MLDIVDMAVDRRQHRADRIFDRSPSIHVYTDSSPVTGEELQGMVADYVYKDGPTRRSTLPGASLAYGAFNAVAKCLCLVWACFLIAGPEFIDMAYWFSKVASITSDNGVEIHILEVPWILDAFARWMLGSPLADCAIYVDYNRRQFWNAMRVSGWCHNWSNLMKTVAHVCPKWPTVLQQLSCLVLFFRNKTYRKWLRRALMGVAGVDTDKLKHFPASMAKWRYQTIPFTMQCLLNLRWICQLQLRPEFFNHAQDKTFIKEVFEAAKDEELWQFMEACYTFLMMPSEDCRRWGLTCGCPQHVKMRTEDHVKHIPCFWNGKQLAASWPYLEVEKEAILDVGRTLTEEDCEGNSDVFQCIVVMLVKKMSCIDQLFWLLIFTTLGPLSG